MIRPDLVQFMQREKPENDGTTLRKRMARIFYRPIFVQPFTGPAATKDPVRYAQLFVSVVSSLNFTENMDASGAIM